MPQHTPRSAGARSRTGQIAQIILGGFLLILVPVLAVASPGPFGTIVFAVGLALVLKNSRRARRHYVRASRRHPRLKKAVDFGLRRKRGKAVAAGGKASVIDEPGPAASLT